MSPNDLEVERLLERAASPDVAAAPPLARIHAGARRRRRRRQGAVLGAGLGVVVLAVSPRWVLPAPVSEQDSKAVEAVEGEVEVLTDEHADLFRVDRWSAGAAAPDEVDALLAQVDEERLLLGNACSAVVLRHEPMLDPLLVAGTHRVRLVEDHAVTRSGVRDCTPVSETTTELVDRVRRVQVAPDALTYTDAQRQVVLVVRRSAGTGADAGG